MGHIPALDAVVVGAGVVGLAAAAALARGGRSVLVVERHQGVARETSSRNSQVIHAGIYYPPGSLKAELCTRGRELLYPWLAEHGVEGRKLGKLVVARDEDERPGLETLLERGRANGVPGLRLLEAGEVKRREPHLACAGALYSPETGVVDAPRFALSLLAEAEAHNAVALLHHEVVSLRGLSSGWRVTTRPMGDQREESVDCELVVNAAGLASDRVAALAGVDVDAEGYRLRPCKGSYFLLDPGAGLVLSHLVYPAPPGPASSGGGGLGIHATPEIGGGLRFGPDAEYVSEVDLEVDDRRAEHFAEAIAGYLPGMQARWLRPDFAGIRPKLAGPGEGFRDFVVQEESGMGLPGLINCIGIESPGLTAALAIGERVSALAAGRSR